MKLEHLALAAGGLYLLSGSLSRSPKTIMPVGPPFIASAVSSGAITPSVGISQLHALTYAAATNQPVSGGYNTFDLKSYNYAVLDIQAQARAALNAANYNQQDLNVTWLMQRSGGDLPFGSPQVQSALASLKDLHDSIVAPFQAQLDALNASVVPGLRSVIKVNA